MAKMKSVIAEIIVFVIFIIFMLPFVIVIINSAKPTMLILTDVMALPENPSQFIANVKTVLTSTNINYIPSFFSSLIITFFSVLLIILSSSMAAWVLVRNKTGLSNFIFMMFVAAMVIPFQVVMFPLVSWLHQMELLLPFRLLQNYPGIILAYLGFGSSLSIFLYHGFIKSIPLELEEAATIDGCSKAGLFFRIVFPILQPISITVMILNGIWIWNDFLLPQLVLGSGNKVQTLPLAVAGFVGSFVKKWDLILTSTLMAMLPIVILFLFVQKHIIKGMVDGSVKG